MFLKKYINVLTIAGSDSSGGAGIQADIKTFSSLGCYGMSVITAITAQNTQIVSDILPLPAEIIKKQADAILSDIKVDAIKIGMLHSIETIRIVKNIIETNQLKNIILDPVMVATSGDLLISKDAIDVLIYELFPLVDIITPNQIEAEIILNTQLKTIDDLKNNVIQLLNYGNKSVLLKGGRLEGKYVYDFYCDLSDRKIHLFKNNKIDSHNTHGTGCSLSSAITAILAKENNLLTAVTKGIEYTHNAILEGQYVKTGNGHGPINHFFNPLKLIKTETNEIYKSTLG